MEEMGTVVDFAEQKCVESGQCWWLYSSVTVFITTEGHTSNSEAGKICGVMLAQ